MQGCQSYDQEKTKQDSLKPVFFLGGIFSAGKNFFSYFSTTQYITPQQKTMRVKPTYKVKSVGNHGGKQPRIPQSSTISNKNNTRFRSGSGSRSRLVRVVLDKQGVYWGRFIKPNGQEYKDYYSLQHPEQELNNHLLHLLRTNVDVELDLSLVNVARLQTTKIDPKRGAMSLEAMYKSYITGEMSQVWTPIDDLRNVPNLSPGLRNSVQEALDSNVSTIFDVPLEAHTAMPVKNNATASSVAAMPTIVSASHMVCKASDVQRLVEHSRGKSLVDIVWNIGCDNDDTNSNINNETETNNNNSERESESESNVDIDTGRDTEDDNDDDDTNSSNSESEVLQHFTVLPSEATVQNILKQVADDPTKQQLVSEHHTDATLPLHQRYDLRSALCNVQSGTYLVQALLSDGTATHVMCVHTNKDKHDRFIINLENNKRMTLSLEGFKCLHIIKVLSVCQVIFH